MMELVLVIATALVWSLTQQQAAAQKAPAELAATPAISVEPVKPSFDGAGAASEADQRLCVQEEYLTRLVQLQINSGAVMAATPIGFACNDNAKPFFIAYYNDLDPPAAVITYGEDQAIIFPQVAASGAKYGRTGIEFWEHHGSARVDFYGIKLECTPVP
jgi:membrane-bound inhibitor of C-type lysozyme